MLKKYNDDKILDETIIKVQYELSSLGSILTDYINHGVCDANHPVLVDRTAEEFIREFSSQGACCIDLIDKIRLCLSKKTYTHEHLAAKAFLDTICCNEYFIYNINIIEICIKDYIDKICNIFATSIEPFYNHPLLKGKVAFMSELLYDVSEFLERLYIAKCNYYRDALKEGIVTEDSVLFVTKNRPNRFKTKKSTAFEIYQNIQNSMDRYFYYDSVCNVPTAMFQIRQAIEIRLWEIFGIKAICDAEGEIIKITADKLLGLEGLETNVDLHIKLSNLLLIHKWTNIYVHIGVTGNYWLIYFAAECIKEFVVLPAVMDDEYYATLNDCIEKYVCKIEKCICRILWSKNKCCLSKSQLKQKETFEKEMLNNLNEMQ